MAQDSSNVRVGVTGALYVNNGGQATAPTDSTTQLTSAWADLGYVSEDGVTETRDRKSDTLKGWQRADVVRETVTEASFQIKAVLIETKKETVEMYYGTTVDASGKIVINAGVNMPIKPHVLDVVDGDEFIRTYIPKGQVTEVGDQVYKNGEPIGYEVTVKGYYDATVGGNAVKWYSSLKTGA